MHEVLVNRLGGLSLTREVLANLLGGLSLTREILVNRLGGLSLTREVLVNLLGGLSLTREVLVNRSGGLSLTRESVVRLTDCPDMTIAVYCGRKTTTQQHINALSKAWMLVFCGLTWWRKFKTLKKTTILG